VSRADRDQLATRLVLAYWLTLVGGLVVFTTTRFDDSPTVVALWLGALGGTMLGQYLALRDYRLWIVGLILVLCAMYGAPLVPDGAAGTALWQAFVPAVLCGFWSLGDRASIAACWFPAVIWMLSILDRADGKLAPDGVGATLLAGFVVAFLAILRARETRRAALWQAVAAVPLAPVQPAELLREPPGRQLARAGWGLSVGAIAVALTVWIAPRLWHVEPLGGAPVQVGGRSPAHGLPCCPIDGYADTASSRVKEYFNLGRGHGESARPPREGIECRACAAALPAMIGGGYVGGDQGHLARRAASGTSDPWATARPDGDDEAGERRTFAPGELTADEAPVADEAPAASGAQVAPAMDHAPPAAPVVPPVVAPIVAPIVAPAAPPLPTTQHLADAPHAPPPSVAPSGAPPRTSSPAPSASILPWLVALATAALLFQVVALALRPVRRLITLRHLRRPFWDETVDQRVSNAWQLALVGLHDAGWRPGALEAPHALARRVGVVELERCATILERARHGLGIDAEDLEAMRGSADAAYHAARRELGTFARVVGWIRWPLT
jgi:hypothetical protein